MQLHRNMQKKRKFRTLSVFNLLNFSSALWTDLALGFAGNDFNPSPNISFFASMIFRSDDLIETVIATALLVTLGVLHVLGSKKYEGNETDATADQTVSLKTECVAQFSTTNRASIAIIDDDIFIRESWELFLQEFDLITFDSPESFLLALDRNSDLINTLDAIVVDYDFGTQSTMSGADLASILRKRTSSPIILSTDREQKDIPDFDRFDLHLDKNILDWHALQKLLPSLIS